MPPSRGHMGFVGQHGRRGSASSYSCRHVDHLLAPRPKNPRKCWVIKLDGRVLGRGESEQALKDYNRQFRIGGEVVREDG